MYKLAFLCDMQYLFTKGDFMSYIYIYIYTHFTVQYANINLLEMFMKYLNNSIIKMSDICQNKVGS